MLLPTLTLSRGTKALSLVPLALLSGAWTIVVASSGAVEGISAPAASTDSVLGALPETVGQGPATAPAPGGIAPAVPFDAVDWIVNSASPNEIPAPALAAYQRAAKIINATDPDCRVPWELLGAIGRVESDHGRLDDNILGADGLARPGVIGIALDGSGGTARIADTDGGDLDMDPFIDRTVGPMQLLPSAWSQVKVDADGDGSREPQDIDDAALAAAIYLCSGEGDLSQREGQESAVFRYNPRRDYVNLVLRVMEGYAVGAFSAVPAGAYGGRLFIPTAQTQLPVKHRKPTTVHDPDVPPEATPPDAESVTPATVPAEAKEDVVKPSVGLAKAIGGVIERPDAAVPLVMSTLAATTQCLQSGIAALDISALTACVRDLVT